MTAQPTIQRYELVWVVLPCSEHQEMESDTSGEWIRHADHLAAMARAEKPAEEAMALLERARVELGKYHFSEDGEYNNDTTMETSDLIVSFLFAHYETKDKS